jgi:hypothetical protein
LKRAKKLLPSVVWLEGLSRVAHKAGVRVKASSAEKAMEKARVTENWR